MATVSSNPVKWKWRWTRRRFLWSLAAGLPLSAAADAVWWEPASLRIKTMRISLRPSLRIAHFTDLHYRGDRDFVAHVVERINLLAPDLVFFTGDLVEDKVFVAPALELISGIKAPLFGVPGNHDYWSHADFDQISQVFKRSGGAWLLDQSISTAGGRCLVTGASGMSQKEFAPRPGCCNIMLIHYPLWVDYLQPGFDLILAGHSHGGQVRLPFYGALIVPFNVGRYDLGYFSTSAGPLYVNPGIGYFFSRVRFRCRPELTVFEI